MLLALDVAYNARNELSAPIVNVFDNDIVATTLFVGDMEEFTRSRSDIVKFTREEGHLWMSPRDRMTTPKSRHKLPNVHFSRVDCMFRVDDRMSCIDYPVQTSLCTPLNRLETSEQAINTSDEVGVKDAHAACLSTRRKRAAFVLNAETHRSM